MKIQRQGIKWIIVLSHKNRSEWWNDATSFVKSSYIWVLVITNLKGLPQETKLGKQDTTWWRLSSWPGQPDSHKNTSSLNESHLEKRCQHSVSQFQYSPSNIHLWILQVSYGDQGPKDNESCKSFSKTVIESSYIQYFNGLIWAVIKRGINTTEFWYWAGKLRFSKYW